MPYLTTNTLTSRPTRGLGIISQVIIKAVNNGSSKAVQELFEVNYREVVTKIYNITQTYFQFNAVYSQEQTQIQIFLVDSAGVLSQVALEQLEVSRITSEFRENIAVTASDFALISYRRNPAIVIPEAVAAEIKPVSLPTPSAV
ncbi:hypothetical protein [Paenibacillus sonchi]|uniref:hypothetical protein n=1 Tax=Paenibacillus sonchi TaxID=373687 RepID=UPI001E313003|nr:hypothetical protein [Paenibacillus sonchi]MCE3198294.1 hypothetical protein [Paenibacillus sonchi]